MHMKKSGMMIVLLAAILMQPLVGQRTIRMNLERVISDAGIIVHGTVASVSTGADSATNLLSTFVTIDVIEDFYGAGKQQITLKMIGGSSATKTVRLAGMTKFTPGEEIFAMFFKPSKTGFTSPVGMGQGKFTVISDSASQRRVIRLDTGSAGPFSGIKNTSALAKREWVTQPVREVDAEDFSATLRSLITILKK